MTKTTVERQARFREKMRGAGCVRVDEWVPKQDAWAFRQVAKALRENFKTDEKSEGFTT